MRGQGGRLWGQERRTKAAFSKWAGHQRRGPTDTCRSDENSRVQAHVAMEVPSCSLQGRSMHRNEWRSSCGFIVSTHRQRRELLRELLSPLLPQPDLVVRVGNSGGLLLLRRDCGEGGGKEGLRACGREMR